MWNAVPEIARAPWQPAVTFSSEISPGPVSRDRLRLPSPTHTDPLVAPADPPGGRYLTVQTEAGPPGLSSVLKRRADSCGGGSSRRATDGAREVALSRGSQAQLGGIGSGNT